MNRPAQADVIKVGVGGPQANRGARAFALWNLGFRPFYLLASIFAASSILLWICQYTGQLPAAYLRSPAWHGHEMLFGYTMAVVAGFLLTAVANWTGKPTPTGPALAALAALWLVGRVLVLTRYDIAAAIANVAFPLALALSIGNALVQSRNRRNYFFVVLLLVLGLAVLAFHLAHLDVIAWPERTSLQASLDILMLVMVVIGGRVIPMFTNNGIAGAQATRQPSIEKLALLGALVLVGVDVLPASAVVVAVMALSVAFVHAIRLWRWQPWRTLRAPLVLVLHISYGWIIVYLVLRGLAELGLVSRLLAVHALTIGAIGGMTLGMMTRTARGHTGRPLHADRFDAACFMLVSFAAVSRVFGGMWMPGRYATTVVVSGVCWSAAFALYAVRYWPVLSRARVDGKAG